MQTVTVLAEASMALDRVAGGVADIVASLPDAHVPIPGSDWTVRDAAAHLVAGSTLYTEIANGAVSPYQSTQGDGPEYRSVVAAQNAQRLADLPETDPGALARLILDASGRLIDTICGRPDDQPVSFHCGIPLTVAGLACTLLSEHVIHGYDIAAATGAPWPIDPAHAGLILRGVAPLFALCVNPSTTRGLTVAYEVELRGAGRLVIGFDDGVFRLEPADGQPVDCTISCDPVAYLLVSSRRLSQSAAISLGLISAGGDRPELALRLNDLFVYP